MGPTGKRPRLEPNKSDSPVGSASTSAGPGSSLIPPNKRTRTTTNNLALHKSTGSASSNQGSLYASTSASVSLARSTSLHPPSAQTNSSSRPSPGPTPFPPQPKLNRADSDSTVSLAGSGSGTVTSVRAGDTIVLEGYRDVTVLSVQYDDIVACRAISVVRGDLPVLIKLSLSAKPSAAAVFKQEAQLLYHLRDAGINCSKMIAKEATRMGVSKH